MANSYYRHSYKFFKSKLTPQSIVTVKKYKINLSSGVLIGLNKINNSN